MNNISNEELMTMLMEVDEDGSGEIEFPEFAKMMGGMQSKGEAEKTQRKEILKAFELFEEKDLEFDLLPGKITFERLRGLASDLGETLSDEELQETLTDEE